MALEECPACNKAISVNARSCPNCGEPLKQDWAKAVARSKRPPSKFKSFLIAVVLGTLVPGGILVGLETLFENDPATQSSAQMDIPPREPTPTELQAKAEQAARERAEMAKRRAEEAARQERHKRQAFMTRLRREMASFETFNIDQFTGTNFGFLAVNTVFQVWAGMIEEAKGLSLAPEDQEVVRQFRAGAVKVQTWALPKIRDAYGPHIRKMLWEKNVTARTFGEGYRTVEFVGGLFAANRNIKVFNEELWETFLILRFKQTRYKWLKDAEDYTYFNVDGPEDGDLVIWGNGAFRTIK